MNVVAKIKYAFARYDRITINGDTYRWVKFQHGHHLFQRVTENVHEQVLEDDCLSYTDQEIHVLVRRKLLTQEHAYYSKALAELRMRQDNTDLTDLDEEEVRTLFWKREWCVRYNRARAGMDGYPYPPTMTQEDLDWFIDLVKDEVARWYFKQYGEHRRAGRIALVRQKDGSFVRERKQHDYPSASSLRDWLRRYREADNRIEAFIDRYDHCGHRAQLHPEVEAILNRCVKGYSALNRPTREHICEDIKVELLKLNARRPGQPKLEVSVTTINRRIDRMNPFLVEAGRQGLDAALRAYAPAGQGVRVLDFLDRIEIDDWTVDLFAVICKTPAWRDMDAEARKKIPRVRATVTVAIDCATRTIVGLNISETAPSTAGAKGAVQTIVMDKNGMAELAEARSDWPMQGRPRLVVTDGGPVFRGEFERAVSQVRSDRTLPDHDPRMRPYVESVNRTLKAFCRYFTGQSFANVVELGDYEGEAMASLTFEAFQKAFIQFVVDKYHRRAHRGLGGLSPYAMWELLAQGVREAPIGDAKRISVFGFREKNRRLDKHGVLNIGISYWSQELALLFTLMGHGAKVDFFVDPTCVGRVLVIVPKALREDLRNLVIANDIKIHSQSSMGFLMVPSTDVSLWNKSLSEFANINPELQAAIEATRERDKNFRLHAHESLTNAGQRAWVQAGIQDHLMTQKKWDALMAFYRGKVRAATPVQTVETVVGGKGVEQLEHRDDDDGYGVHVANGRATGNRRPAPEAGNRPEPRQIGQAVVDEDVAVAAPVAPPADDDDFDIPDINDIGLDGDEE